MRSQGVKKGQISQNQAIFAIDLCPPIRGQPNTVSTKGHQREKVRFGGTTELEQKQFNELKQILHLKVGCSDFGQGQFTLPTYLPTYVEKKMLTCCFNDMPSQVTSSIKLFADDTKLYCRVPDDGAGLQADIDALVRWSEKWLLPLTLPNAR